jgi:hypothetical protein
LRRSKSLRRDQAGSIACRGRREIETSSHREKDRWCLRPRNAAYYREAARRVLRLQAKYLIIGAKEAR